MYNVERKVRIDLTENEVRVMYREYLENQIEYKVGASLDVQYLSDEVLDVIHFAVGNLLHLMEKELSERASAIAIQESERLCEKARNF